MIIDNLGIIVPPNLINKKLLPEMFQNVLSYLYREDLQAASEVNPLWKASVFKMVIFREFFPVCDIARSLSQTLDERLYSKQKNELSNLTLSTDGIETPTELQLRIGVITRSVEYILLRLELGHFEKWLDSFLGKKKPKLFYRFSCMSGKYSQLHAKLLDQVKARASPETIQGLIDQGAMPTMAALNKALQIQANFEVKKDEVAFETASRRVKILMNAGVGPTLESLNIIIRYRNAPKTVQLVLNAGVIPREIELFNALTHKASYEIVRALLEAGAMSTKKTLKTTVLYKADVKVVRALIFAGAEPTEKILRRALKNNLIVRLFLDKGVMPIKKTLKTARLVGADTETMKYLKGKVNH